MAGNYTICIGTIGSGAWLSRDGGDEWHRVRAGLDGESRVYRPIHENISSVAFWYQQGAHAPYPALPPDAELQPQRR